MAVIVRLNDLRYMIDDNHTLKYYKQCLLLSVDSKNFGEDSLNNNWKSIYAESLDDGVKKLKIQLKEYLKNYSLNAYDFEFTFKVIDIDEDGSFYKNFTMMPSDFTLIEEKP